MNNHNAGVIISLFLIVSLAGICLMTASPGTTDAPVLRESTNHNLITTLESDGFMQTTYDTVNQDGSITTHTDRTRRV